MQVLATTALDGSIAKNDRFLRAVVDTIPGLVAYWNNDLRCEFANKQYLEWFGIDSNSLVGMKMNEVIGDHLFLENLFYIRGVLSGKLQQFEREIKKYTGQVCQTLSSYIPDVIDGNVVGFVVQVTDVTVLKETEAALKTEITRRERKNDLLHESRTALRKAQALGQIGSWEWDAVEDAVVWSDELYRIMGCDPAGVPPSFAEHPKLYLPESWSLLQQAVERALKTGEPYLLELQFVRPDGEHGWLEGRGEAITDEGGRVIALHGTAQDITRRKTIELELWKTKQFLERSGAVAGVGGWEYDLLTGESTWSDQTCILHDVEPGHRPTLEEALGYYTASSRPIIEKAVQDSIESGASWNLELEVCSAAGRVFWARATGAVVFEGDKAVRLIGAFQDITLARSAQIAVRTSEARYRMLAESTSDVITQLDLHLVRRYVSPACRTVLGYDPEEMIGSNVATFIHPDDAGAVHNMMEMLAAGTVSGDRATIIKRLKHKDGHWIWLESSVSLVRDPETGAPQTLISALRDVTERQRAAFHLEEAKAAAEHAAKLKAEFVANMSHELRTPLTDILGIHDILRNDSSLGQQQKHFVDLAREAGRSLLTIVNDVLDFSKIDAGQLSIETIPFELDRTIEACCDLGREEGSKKGLQIGLKLENASVTLVGDPGRLRQITLNLLTNALKFTDKGCVDVRAHYRSEHARLRVEVSDTGIGIPEDQIPTLFERFSQADTSITRRYGGTGLGLAICKRLVELMGGEIGVQSRPGLGSTFWFELPLPLAPSAGGEVAITQIGSTAQARRVLLAEDNLLNQEVITAMLEQRGHKVSVVGNGAAAVTAAQSGGYDIVLLDMQMPIMDGLSAARAIRAGEANEKRPAMPIIGLTANAMAEDIRQCQTAGMDAHVAKPIDWAELFTTIDQFAVVPVPVEASAALQVLDQRKLEELLAVLGRDRVAKMLHLFICDIERRLPALDSMTVFELGLSMHSLMSLSGQFGLNELSNLCASIERDTRNGKGFERLSELRVVAEGAVAATQSYLIR